MIETHTCPDCKQQKPLTEFYDHLGKCKVCKARSGRERYAANKQNISKQQKQYRIAKQREQTTSSGDHHECPQCNRIKPLDAFYKELGGCKECKRGRMKDYRRKKRLSPEEISEQREYIPLPCEIAFRCARIRDNWSPRIERARAGAVERPLEVDFVAIGGMRRKVFR